MRIGTFVAVGGTAGVDDIVAAVKGAERDGFHSAWVSNIFAHDGITVCALAGRETQRIELGTAVVPTYPRHPAAIAQQALTAQASCKGRFALGIGLSHRVVIEQMFGLDYSKPIRHAREYLTILDGLLSGRPVQFEGSLYTVRATLTVPDATKPVVLVAALGPQMLDLAGRLADGTSTWMGGPKYLATQAVPIITKAAADAGRPSPRIVAGMPCALTGDVEGGKAAANQAFAMYGQLPSYRAVLDVEGSPTPSGACLIGDESSFRAQLKVLADAGVTDLNAATFPIPADDGVAERTYRFLADVAQRGV